MPDELAKTAAVNVPAVSAAPRLPAWSSGQGGRPASPGMSSSSPNTTTRTRRKPT